MPRLGPYNFRRGNDQLSDGRLESKWKSSSAVRHKAFRLLSGDLKAWEVFVVCHCLAVCGWYDFENR